MVLGELGDDGNWLEDKKAMEEREMKIISGSVKTKVLNIWRLQAEIEIDGEMVVGNVVKIAVPKESFSDGDDEAKNIAYFCGIQKKDFAVLQSTYREMPEGFIREDEVALTDPEIWYKNP